MNRRGRVSPGTAAPVEERSCSWLKPWVFLVSVLVIKTAFVTICLVVFLHGTYGQYKTLLQNATEWCCVPNIFAGKKESWMCCPKGWKRFQESCYYLSDDKMRWAESVQNCTGMGSHLVVINSEAEQHRLPSATSPSPQGLLLPPSAQSCTSWTLCFFQEFLFNLAKRVFTNAYETKYYIGLTAYENGQWQWVDQTPYKKAATFWKPGEPNLLFAEKCAAIHVKGNTDSSTYSNWNNILCFTSCYRICELAVKFV
ncbi:C-type lectin domain family 4 member E-like isoform X1 [Grus americana]|uniref:C-type lectin domain family 4 member E-like isoform X1 n=1 Tax=Grus americana TaxID=9117 RepID=UPI0024088790|nr:C-type lectin domain family 4 member E-like isoform X1 [Grus americana]XP_054676638.1 C-type lectin domain family 4 member E-like isoform X1 [Grus americana]